MSSTLALLAIGNIMGTIMLGQSIGHLARRWLWLGRGGTPAPRRDGVVVTDDALRELQPAVSTHADVLARCGRPQEERQRLTGRGRTLVYRGSVVTTHRRFGVGWLATVSHREIEHREVVIEIEDDHIRDVESRVSRSRFA
jgi:hypothetical protein